MIGSYSLWKIVFLTLSLLIDEASTTRRTIHDPSWQVRLSQSKAVIPAKERRPGG
jgi:hypothetical protein